jgi:hypothetical protein
MVVRDHQLLLDERHANGRLGGGTAGRALTNREVDVVGARGDGEGPRQARRAAGGAGPQFGEVDVLERIARQLLVLLRRRQPGRALRRDTQVAGDRRCQLAGVDRHRERDEDQALLRLEEVLPEPQRHRLGRRLGGDGILGFLRWILGRRHQVGAGGRPLHHLVGETGERSRFLPLGRGRSFRRLLVVLALGVQGRERNSGERDERRQDHGGPGGNTLHETLAPRMDRDVELMGASEGTTNHCRS